MNNPLSTQLNKKQYSKISPQSNSDVSVTIDENYESLLNSSIVQEKLNEHLHHMAKVSHSKPLSKTPSQLLMSQQNMDALGTLYEYKLFAH